MTLLFPIVFFSVLDYTYFNWRKNSMKVKNSLDEILLRASLMVIMRWDKT